MTIKDLIITCTNINTDDNTFIIKIINNDIVNVYNGFYDYNMRCEYKSCEIDIFTFKEKEIEIYITSRNGC